MATFDTNIGIGYETEFTPDAGSRMLKMDDGTLNIINDYNQTVYDVEIVCPFCTQTQLNVILLFYAANRDLYWTFYHPADGNFYTLLFKNEPRWKRNETYGDVQYTVNISASGYLD